MRLSEWCIITLRPVQLAEEGSGRYLIIMQQISSLLIITVKSSDSEPLRIFLIDKPDERI